MSKSAIAKLSAEAVQLLQQYESELQAKGYDVVLVAYEKSE
jgi:hypothetical protein